MSEPRPIHSVTEESAVQTQNARMLWARAAQVCAGLLLSLTLIDAIVEICGASRGLDVIAVLLAHSCVLAFAAMWFFVARRVPMIEGKQLTQYVVPTLQLVPIGLLLVYKLPRHVDGNWPDVYQTLAETACVTFAMSLGWAAFGLLMGEPVSASVAEQKPSQAST